MEQAARLSPSKLVLTSVLEPKDELNEKLERFYNTVTGIQSSLSEREANDALNSFACRGTQQHEEIQLGLLYGILTDPKMAPKHYRDLTLVSRDGLTIVLTKTNQIIFEKWLKLLDSTRAQIVWLCKELIQNGILGSDSVCHSLIRQIAGGDISPKKYLAYGGHGRHFHRKQNLVG